MTESAVYLCPSCNEAVRSEGQERDQLRCEACGFHFGGSGQSSTAKIGSPPKPQTSSAVVRNVVQPAEKKVAVAGKAPQPVIRAKIPGVRKIEASEPEPEVKGDDEVTLPDGTKQVRRRKKRRKEKNKPLYLFLGGWLLLVALIIAFFQGHKLFKDKEENDDFVGPQLTETERRHRALKEKYQLSATRAFDTFLSSDIHAGRLQTIDSSSALASRFGRYYEFAKPLNLPPGMRLAHIQVVEFAEGEVSPGIESIWSTSDGHEVEVLSLWDGKEWKIDWEHLVRYNSTPWPLFRVGAGATEGEFRLLVRKVDLSTPEIIQVVFYEPARPGKSETNGVFESRSPDVEIPSTSELGRQFERLWTDFEYGVRYYDSKFADGDLKGHMRITVRLAWELDEDDRKKMVLRDIIEPYWYGRRIQEVHKKHPPVIERVDSESLLQTLDP